MNPFRKAPIVTLVAWGTTLLAVLIALQGSGVLTGRAAQWVDAAAGLLQVVLTAYARMHVTPVAAPKDASGRPLVLASMRPKRAGQASGFPKCSHGYVWGSPEHEQHRQAGGCFEMPSDAQR